jgi:drug/metabolite transporter (DMT)-like permease
MSNRIRGSQHRAVAAPPERRDIILGVAAILTATTVWGTWIVITRFGVTAALSPYDAAFLRFAIPSIILLPVLLREGLALRRIGILRTALIVAGAGAPAFLISTSGMQFAPAAHAGALLPGTMPLFVAVLAASIYRERISASRLGGFALIIAGVIAIGGYSLFASPGGEWRGHLLFITAAFLWAVYTIAFRSAGIGPWHAAAVINFWSIVGFAPVYLVGLDSQLLDAPWREVALQALSQGLLSGIVAIIAYGAAVRRLGAARAAVFTSLTPVIAALIGIVALGEQPDAATVVGIVAVSLGVALASGAAGQRAFSALASVLK